MEDITKYIGLLEVVPFVIFLIIFWKKDKEVFFELVKIFGLILMILFIAACLIWGITTLGRLL